MREFKDNADRTWTVAVNVNAVKRVRDLLDVNLLDLASEGQDPKAQLLYRLMADPVLLCDVIYVVCKPEADAAGISDEDFGRSMAGDAIDHATRALLEEIVNFSPSQRDRARLTRIMSATWVMLDKAQDLLDVKASQQEIDRRMADVLKTLGEPSGDSPGSSDSTPGP